jgi:hypothetical protein
VIAFWARLVLLALLREALLSQQTAQRRSHAGGKFQKQYDKKVKNIIIYFFVIILCPSLTLTARPLPPWLGGKELFVN